MTILPKIFTRDFPIVLCQVWGRRYKTLFDAPVSAAPRNVFVFESGLVETYRNPAANRAMNDIILSAIGRQPDFIGRTVAAYAPRIATLNTYCSRSGFAKRDLTDLLDLLLDCWQILYIGMYIPGDERFSRRDRDAAMAFRTANDRVEYDAFAAVVAALQSVFPGLWPLAKYVYLDELYSGRTPSAAVLQERARGRMFVVDDEVADGSRFESLREQLDFELEAPADGGTGNVSEVRGQAACAGKAVGTVRILMKHEDIASFPEEAILVTSMTVPTFLPAMKKAAAFVTDEGGITCHAAIVARELKKPCIIGTKTATKVFKNGDLVEVDADNGIVRVLERLGT